MKEEDKQRIERLIAWIRAHRKDLLGDDGAISPSAFSKAVAAGDGKGGPAYWSERLRCVAGKSFAAQAARDVEIALQIPAYQLEGLGWQFEEIDFRRFDKLSPSQKGRVQEVMLQKIAAIELENSQREVSRTPDKTPGIPSTSLRQVTPQNQSGAREQSAHSGSTEGDEAEIAKTYLSKGRGGGKNVASPIDRGVQSKEHGDRSTGASKKGRTR